MVKKADIPDHVIDTALKLAAESGLTEARVRAALPRKSAIVTALMRRVDAAVAAGGATDADDSARDRLFDVLMRRLDALAPYKAGLASVLADTATRPLTGWTTAVLRGSRLASLQGGTPSHTAGG